MVVFDFTMTNIEFRLGLRILIWGPFILFPSLICKKILTRIHMIVEIIVRR